MAVWLAMLGIFFNRGALAGLLPALYCQVCAYEVLPRKFHKHNR